MSRGCSFKRDPDRHAADIEKHQPLGSDVHFRVAHPVLLFLRQRTTPILFLRVCVMKDKISFRIKSRFIEVNGFFAISLEIENQSNNGQS
jgi:hypothetical protein